MTVAFRIVICAAAARARTNFTKGQTSTRKGTARTQWNYHPSCSPRQSYQRADEYLKGSVPPLSAITRPLHFPAVVGRSARVCVLDPAELYARAACMHAYFVWVLYEYVLDLADDCPVRVCLAESGARGRGRVLSTPLTCPCGPGISVWQRWARDVAKPCMPAEGCGSKVLR